MALNNADKKQFRKIGHSLKPIVTIAENGINDNIRKEIERALEEHELIKIKVVTDREGKKGLTESICEEFGAECVQSIGHIILLYRAARKPNPKLSNILRNQSG